MLLQVFNLTFETLLVVAACALASGCATNSFGSKRGVSNSVFVGVAYRAQRVE